MKTARNPIDDLAAAVGAAPRASLPANEIESFTVGRDGRVSVQTASGEQLVVALDRDVDVAGDGRGPAALTSATLLRKLVPEIVRYGGRVPRGVTFFRRARIVGGERVVEFCEAGK